jgi:hypothetical protein
MTMNENEAIPVYLEDVLDFLEREYQSPVDRWLRLRELLKLQKSAQQPAVRPTPAQDAGGMRKQ